MAAVTRRQFIFRSGLVLASSMTPAILRAAEKEPSAIQARERPLLVSTWPFGKPANEAGLKVLENGGSALDAVEQGICVTEASANASVGLGGTPNSAGVVQLDACIMFGPGHKAGSVAALEGI